MRTSWRLVISLGVALGFVWLLAQALPKSDQRNQSVDITGLRAVAQADPSVADLETAMLGGGCFWCVEAVFERIKGVVSVESGYAGGESQNPSYQEIGTGKSGHAECVQVRFDPKILSFDDLLTVFWELHDPTTKNRQGADRGSQYRSVIFYHSEEQKMIAENSLATKDASEHLRRGIVTEIVPAPTFYPAEGYHQDYFDSNPNAGYCRQIISPKLRKLGLLD